jgi:hypothetical protein
MRTTFVLLVTFLGVGCTGTVEQAQSSYESELKELIPIKGHDPVEEGVFTDPYLKHRLITLLGEGKYDTLVSVMYDCSPIGFNNDLLYWVGYGKENPDTDGGAIIIDLANDEIYVGYEIGDKIRIYSEGENVDRRPNKLKLWLKRRDNVIKTPKPENNLDSLNGE